jgi:hypothetical protein
MKREITINLEHGLEYALKGDSEDAKFITLKAPTAKNISDCSLLKKLFTNAALALNKHNEKSEKQTAEKTDDAETSGSDVMELIYAFGNSEDIEKGMIAAKNIFKNCGYVDGEVQLTMPLIDKISAEDFESMVGEYISNFTAASMLGKKQKKN